MSNEISQPGPEAMREMVGDYVRAVHTTYLDHVAQLSHAERGGLPLVTSQSLTVVAAASRRLHLIATTDPFPPLEGQEIELAGRHRGVTWTVRFFDPSIVPALGTVEQVSREHDGGPDPALNDVRSALGINDVVYHLAVVAGGVLDDHHAQHSGVALANLHAKTFRDLDRLRSALPRQARLVDELGSCVRSGLDRAAALLVADLSAGRVRPDSGASAHVALEALIREVAPGSRSTGRGHP